MLYCLKSFIQLSQLFYALPETCCTESARVWIPFGEENQPNIVHPCIRLIALSHVYRTCVLCNNVIAGFSWTCSVFIALIIIIKADAQARRDRQKMDAGTGGMMCGGGGLREDFRVTFVVF